MVGEMLRKFIILKHLPQQHHGVVFLKIYLWSLSLSSYTILAKTYWLTVVDLFLFKRECKDTNKSSRWQLKSCCITTICSMYTVYQLIVDGVNVQTSEQPTNEVVYFQALTDMSDLPSHLKPYVPLFCTVANK